MPMIDVYAASGTFGDPHALAQGLASTLKEIEQVPDIPMFRKNTAAFVHDLPPSALSNVDGDSGGHAIAVRAASFLRTVSADLDEPPHVYGVTYDGALVGSPDAGETWRTLCRGWQRVDHVMPYGLRSV